MSFSPLAHWQNIPDIIAEPDVGLELTTKTHDSAQLASPIAASPLPVDPAPDDPQRTHVSQGISEHVVLNTLSIATAGAVFACIVVYYIRGSR